MSNYTFSGPTAYIAMADRSTASLISAMDAMLSQVTGGVESQAPSTANVGFGGGVDLGGFGR